MSLQVEVKPDGTLLVLAAGCIVRELLAGIGKELSMWIDIGVGPLRGSQGVPQGNKCVSRGPHLMLALNHLRFLWPGPGAQGEPRFPLAAHGGSMAQGEARVVQGSQEVAVPVYFHMPRHTYLQ